MSDAPGQSKSFRWGRWLTVVLLLVAITAGGFAIWGTRRFQALIDLGKSAQAEYGRLNTEFPFSPPPPGDRPSMARLEAMLAIREQVWRGLDPRLKAALAETLASPSIDALARRAPELLQLGPALDAGLHQHLASLRAEKMSAGEYLWLLGLAVSECLRAKPSSAAGGAAAAAGYRQVLGRIEAMSRANANPDDDITARQATDEITERYAGRSLSESWVLSRLDAGDPAAYALDLLALAAPGAVDFEQVASKLGR